MVNKGKLVKLLFSLGIKGIICIISLASIAAALVTYQGTVTTTPFQQLSVGTINGAWTIYVNEVNQARYIPGDLSEPTLDTGDTSTYTFKAITDADKVCAVKVELVTAMDQAKFSKFDITVSSSTGAGWGAETLYSAATGTSTKAAIDGLTQGDLAYIHQTTSATVYYEVKVTYSYDKVADTTPIAVQLRLTPLPQDSFA